MNYINKILRHLVINCVTLKSCILILAVSTTLPAQMVNVELFVSSRNTNSVERFNGETGEYLGDFVPSDSGGLSATQEVRFGTDGNLLVSGRGNSHILKFDGVTGAFIGNFTSGYDLDNPTKMTFGPDGNIYVSQWGTAKKKIARFDGVTGQFIDEFTKTDLNEPSGHAWDSLGNLYVACYGSKDVRKFDTSGNFTGVFTQTGHLQGPVNLWFNSDNNLCVLDWTLGSVLVFDGTNGNYLSTFISGLTNAEGITVGPDSNIYICDWTDNNVKRFDQNGNYLGVFSQGGNLVAPNSLVFRVNGSTDVKSGIGSFPQQEQLMQNYPNPFNPSTKIDYEINQPGFVTIKIYDSIGNMVENPVNDFQQSGQHSIIFDGTNLSSGTYVCVLRTNEFIQSRKMILLK